MEVICDHAGHPDCKGCAHEEPHEGDDCRFDGPCFYRGFKCRCIPAHGGRALVATTRNEDLARRLWNQIERTVNTAWPDQDVRLMENQILIMEALAELLEGR